MKTPGSVTLIQDADQGLLGCMGAYVIRVDRGRPCNFYFSKEYPAQTQANAALGSRDARRVDSEEAHLDPMLLHDPVRAYAQDD